MALIDQPWFQVIEINELRVDSEDFTAVHDLTLTIGEGEIYGFIGSNEAGKTSTFKVLGTMLENRLEDAMHGPPCEAIRVTIQIG